MNILYVFLLILLIYIINNINVNNEYFTIGMRECNKTDNINNYSINVSDDTCLDVWSCDSCCKFFDIESESKRMGYIGCDEQENVGEGCIASCPNKDKFTYMMAAYRENKDIMNRTNHSWPHDYFNTSNDTGRTHQVCSRCNTKIGDLGSPLYEIGNEDGNFYTGFYPEFSEAYKNKSEYPCFCKGYSTKGDYDEYCNQFKQSTCCPLRINETGSISRCDWVHGSRRDDKQDDDKQDDDKQEKKCKFVGKCPSYDKEPMACKDEENCCYQDIKSKNPDFYIKLTRDPDTHELNDKQTCDNCKGPGCEACNSYCTVEGSCITDAFEQHIRDKCNMAINRKWCVKDTDKNQNFYNTDDYPNGVCNTHGDIWKCECEKGWYGPLCDERKIKTGTALAILYIKDSTIEIKKPTDCPSNIDNLREVCDEETKKLLPIHDVQFKCLYLSNDQNIYFDNNDRGIIKKDIEGGYIIKDAIKCEDNEDNYICPLYDEINDNVEGFKNFEGMNISKNTTPENTVWCKNIDQEYCLERDDCNNTNKPPEEGGEICDQICIKNRTTSDDLDKRLEYCKCMPKQYDISDICRGNYPKIAGAKILNIDEETDTITLEEADYSIAKGQRIKLINADGKKCNVNKVKNSQDTTASASVPSASDENNILIVHNVKDSKITVQPGSITEGDPSASSNCLLYREKENNHGNDPDGSPYGIARIGQPPEDRFVWNLIDTEPVEYGYMPSSGSGIFTDGACMCPKGSPVQKHNTEKLWRCVTNICTEDDECNGGKCIRFKDNPTKSCSYNVEPYPTNCGAKCTNNSDCKSIDNFACRECINGKCNTCPNYDGIQGNADTCNTQSSADPNSTNGCCFKGISYSETRGSNHSKFDINPEFHLKWTRDSDNKLVKPPLCFTEYNNPGDIPPGTEGEELCDTSCTFCSNNLNNDVCHNVINAGLCKKTDTEHYYSDLHRPKGICIRGWPYDDDSFPDGGLSKFSGAWHCQCEKGWKGPLCDIPDDIPDNIQE